MEMLKIPERANLRAGTTFPSRSFHLTPISPSHLQTPSHLLVSISHLVDLIYPIRWHAAGISNFEHFASIASAIMSISSTPSGRILFLDEHLVHLICLVAI